MLIVLYIIKYTLIWSMQYFYFWNSSIQLFKYI